MSREILGEPIQAAELPETAHREFHVVEKPPDICRVTEHTLSNREAVQMSIGGFAFLNFVYREAGGDRAWLQPTGTSKGIIANFTQEIETNKRIAKEIILFSASQELVELRESKKTIINARLLEKGARSYRELKPEYAPVIAKIIDPPRRETILIMLDEITHAYEETGWTLPDDLKDLKSTYSTLSSDELPTTIRRLTNVQHHIFNIADNQTSLS